MLFKHDQQFDLPDPPSVLHFTKIGKPLKEIDPNIIVTWGKFNKKSNEWIQQLHAYLLAKQSWSLKVADSYLGSGLLAHNGDHLSSVTLYCPRQSMDKFWRDVKLASGRLRINTVKSSILPFEQLKSKIITAYSVMHTWPDEKGKFKLFMHKSSRIARYKYNHPTPKTFINRDNLPAAKTWDVLEEYIKCCTSAGVDPQRKDICDLVRTISEHETDRLQEDELNRIGITVDPEEDE